MGLNPSIPLSINNAPAPQGPLQQAQGAASVQELINAVQLQKQQQQSNAIGQQQQQIQLQQQQQQLKDQQIFNKAFEEAHGDWNTAIQNATSSGASGTFITQAQLARADQVAKLATANKDLLTNEQTKSDALGRDAVALKQVPVGPERDTQYQQMVNAHLHSGAFQPSDFSSATPSDSDLDTAIAHSKASSDMMEEAAALQAKQAALPGAKAEAAQKELSTASQWMGGVQSQIQWDARRNGLKNQVSPDVFSQIPETYSPAAAEAVRQMGITPQQAATAPVEPQELKSWLAQHPGKTPADFMAYKATLVPQFNFNIAAQTGAGKTPAAVAQQFGMSPEAFDQAAEKYYQTGTMPQMGRGAQGMALQRAVMNRTGELHPGASLAAGSAEYASNKASLSKLQTNFDQVNAFENTALKNLDQVAQTGAKVPDLGVRFANVPVRLITGSMLGTPEMAAFRTALLTAQAESAKVLNSANANGVLSDSARHEAQDVLDGNMSFPAMMASINQLKTDFANRHQSYGDQINDIQQRMGGKGGEQGGGQGGVAQYTPPAGSKTAVGPNGHKINVDNGKWVDSLTGKPI